jgi:glutamate--cysteine ligase
VPDASAAAALTRHDVVDHLQVTDTAPSSGPLRVGIEQEWHTYCLVDPGRHLQPAEVLGAVEAGAPLPCGSRITIEPGGQVEVATAPAPLGESLRALRMDGAVVRESLAVAGIATLACGVDPFRDPVRTLRQPRYDAMEAYFDRYGPAGRRMMSGSASIQVNIDNGRAEEVDRRWQLAHHLGPALVAALACSPDQTHRSARVALWSRLDPSRTHSALRSGVLAEDWARYVLEAQVMLLHDDHDRCRPLDGHLTFGQWIEEGFNGRRPTFDDLHYHCTTLFPRVRPRGWLELRWLDALPAGLSEAAVAAIVAALTDEEVMDRALRATADVAHLWEEASEQGPRHRELADAATTVLRDAAVALDRDPATAAYAEAVADAAERWPARGRCPADDIEERLRRGAGVADLADPPVEVARWR